MRLLLFSVFRFVLFIASLLCFVPASQPPTFALIGNESASIGPSARTEHQDSSGTVAIVHVSVIDMRGSSPLRDMAVTIVGGNISEIKKADKISIPKGSLIVDGTGKYLIPGLWDMHVHLKQYGAPGLGFYIANGITGVRDMGGNLELIKTWKTQSDEGQLLAPKIYFTGPIIDGHADSDEDIIGAETEQEGRARVRELRQGGVDFIKVYSTLKREVYFAILDEAKKLNLRVVGHVPVSVSASEASNAGQMSFEHLYGILAECFEPEQKLTWRSPYSTNRQLFAALGTYDESRAKKLFSLFVKNSTWQVPTINNLRVFSFYGDESITTDVNLKYISADRLAKWQRPLPFKILPEDTEQLRAVYQKHLELIGAMYRAGVPLMAGTDSGDRYTLPGFSLHDELELYAKAGIPAIDVLKIATVNPVRFLNLSKKYGTIEKGKKADLVLLDANPIDAIGNTRKIAGVFRNGQYLPRAELDRILDRIRAMNP